MNRLNIIKISTYRINVFSLLMLFSIIADSQEGSFSCANDSYTFLENAIGNRYVITKDRKTLDVYEINSLITLGFVPVIGSAMSPFANSINNGLDP